MGGTGKGGRWVCGRQAFRRIVPLGVASVLVAGVGVAAQERSSGAEVGVSAWATIPAVARVIAVEERAIRVADDAAVEVTIHVVANAPYRLRVSPRGRPAVVVPGAPVRGRRVHTVVVPAPAVESRREPGAVQVRLSLGTGGRLGAGGRPAAGGGPAAGGQAPNAR